MGLAARVRTARHPAGRGDRSVAPTAATTMPPRTPPSPGRQRGYKVRALSRRAARAVELFGQHPNLSVAEGDCRDAASLTAALAGVDAVACCTGTTAFPSNRWVGPSGGPGRSRGAPEGWGRGERRPFRPCSPSASACTPPVQTYGTPCLTTPPCLRPSLPPPPHDTPTLTPPLPPPCGAGGRATTGRARLTWRAPGTSSRRRQTGSSALCT